MRFVWKRNWVRGLVWCIVIAGMVGFIADYYKGLFTTSCDLKQFADIAQAPSMASLVGIIDNPATLGGAVWCKGFMFLTLMLGIGMVYLMTRNLRGDEDAGRLELMRAYPLGIHSPMVASVVLTSVVSVAAGLLSALALIGTGTGTISYAASPPSDTCPDGVGALAAAGNAGAWAFGASIAAIGLLGVGIAALTNQLAPSGGAANGAGIVIFVVFYVIRMVGDLNGTRALLWSSPIGWGELVDPWSANRVLPIVLIVILAVLLVAAGWFIGWRRDMNAGLVASRKGSAHASKLTQTVAGLGARTQRASLIVWLVAIIMFGALLGSVMNKFPQLLKDMPSAAGLAADAMSVMIMSIVALAIGVFAVQSASALRSDEERGVLESQLAAGVSRIGWALKRLAITLVAAVVLLFLGGACIGQVWAQGVGDPTRVGFSIGAIMMHLPAVIILSGVAVLGFGWWPKVATAVTWTVVGALWAIEIVGVALHLPDAVMKALPFIGGPHYPAASSDWAKFFIYLAIGLAFVVVGLIGFRRRDVPK